VSHGAADTDQAGRFAQSSAASRSSHRRRRQRDADQPWLERGSSGEEELTPREEEIVHSSWRGAPRPLQEKKIASSCLPRRTVEHRANAMRKLGMRARVELVRYALRRGLIEPGQARFSKGRTKAQ